MAFAFRATENNTVVKIALAIVSDITEASSLFKNSNSAVNSEVE